MRTGVRWPPPSPPHRDRRPLDPGQGRRLRSAWPAHRLGGQRRPGLCVVAPAVRYRPLGFNDIDQIAKSENMIPGYSIVPPSDTTEDGQHGYGSYTVVNHWPQKLSEQRTLYLEPVHRRDHRQRHRRSGRRAVPDHQLGHRHAHGKPVRPTDPDLGHARLPRGADLIPTGAIMWWKRRPTGTTGLPGRVSDGVRPTPPAAPSSRSASSHRAGGALPLVRRDVDRGTARRGDHGIPP